MVKYSILSFVTDHTKGSRLLVGVAGWCEQCQWHEMLFLEPAQIAQEHRQVCLGMLRVVKGHLQAWEQGERLPYAERDMKPWEDAWWAHVHQLLNHEIVLSEAKVLPDAESSDDLLRFFQSLTQPVACVPVPPRAELVAGTG